MCVAKLKVRYAGAQKSVSFSKLVEIKDEAIFEISKPPAPAKPSSSALANANAAVEPPAEEKTPIQKIAEIVGEIDMKAAGVSFDGKCLPKDSEIFKVGCDSKFLDEAAKFD